MTEKRALYFDILDIYFTTLREKAPAVSTRVLCTGCRAPH